MAAFFEQKIRYSLFYQNLLKIIFFKYSKDYFKKIIPAAIFAGHGTYMKVQINISHWSRPKKIIYIFENRPRNWPKLELCEHLVAKNRVQKP
jgi:hypothetical protein